ncbi:hypothetical protein PoB_004884300 [Plakobranchus ocellatus]|uniref:Uncharacterized protein n=1 Tax=Plakobranchus ocellatus TaxID=259542 RepID=A0AAV4BT23_9GAST|nr:hypothetical protein PoB_004884300 [Plakobranchus ocellatus]
MIRLTLDHKRRRRLRKAPQTAARVGAATQTEIPSVNPLITDTHESTARSAGAGNNSDCLCEKRKDVDPIISPIVSLILVSNINTIVENCLTSFQEDFRFINICHSDQHSNYSVLGSQSV